MTSAEQKLGLTPMELKRRRKRINDALEANPVDVKLLAKMALARGGFLNDGFRQRTWPKLLGIDRYESSNYQSFVTDHPEGLQLWRDVDRSLFHFQQLKQMRERERRQKRQQLFNIMNAVISQNKALTYYQGYHDVCTVFLLVHDDRVAFDLVERVSQFHLRDCMRPNFAQVIEVIRTLFPLLSFFDKELWGFLQQSEVEPFFALPWVITWFSHHIHDLSVVTRLFDVFLVSHPMFSLYLSAALVLERKAEIMSCECEFGSVHTLISRIPPDLDMEKVLVTGYQLMNQLPPGKLLASTSPKIYKSSAFISYPYPWLDEETKPDVILYREWKAKDDSQKYHEDKRSKYLVTEWNDGELLTDTKNLTENIVSSKVSVQEL